MSGTVFVMGAFALGALVFLAVVAFGARELAQPVKATSLTAGQIEQITDVVLAVLDMRAAADEIADVDDEQLHAELDRYRT